MKGFIAALLILLISVAGCGTQFGSASDVSLDILPGEIIIPSDAKIVRLKRGRYAYILKRERKLSLARYYVVGMGEISRTQESTPYEAYCAQFSVVPADDKRALNALAMFGSKDSFNIPVDSKTEADKIMQDMQHLNKAQFVVVFLAKDNQIKYLSRRAKEGDIISVTGTQFKRIKEEKDGIAQPACTGAAMARVFYVTDLTIE